MSEIKNGIKDIVDNIYNDEEVAEARITKTDIKIVVKAFGRQMIKMLRDDGEFNFRGFFKITTKRMGGWDATTFEGNKVNVGMFTRTYFSLSKKAKDFLNS